MWHSAWERHKHCQAFCKQLQNICSPYDECKMHVVLMWRIHHHIPGAMSRKYECNLTCRLGNRMRAILCQRVRGSIRAVRAIWNHQVFLMETRIVANVSDNSVSDKCGSNKCSSDKVSEMVSDKVPDNPGSDTHGSDMYTLTWSDNSSWNKCDWQVRLWHGLWLCLALTWCQRWRQITGMPVEITRSHRSSISCNVIPTMCTGWVSISYLCCSEHVVPVKEPMNHPEYIMPFAVHFDTS